jgi:palmitoyltransferase ZDHHC9/14/18
MSAALCAIFVISSVIYQLLFIANQQEPMYGFGYVFLQAPVSFVLAIYCFILLWLVGGLTLYHCSLILRGVTTHEHVSFTCIYTCVSVC